MTCPPSQQSLTWPHVLALADTPGQLISVVRDFLATWTPREVGALPISCRPPAKFLIPEDVVLYTYTLVEHQTRHGEDDPGVFRMVGFFAEATRRVTWLMGRLPQPAAANDLAEGV